MADILIVEDEVFVREFARMVVGDLGHSVSLAGDLDQAFVLLRSPETIDVLFTDIRLKTATLGGYELAREGVRVRPRLRVLYASGNPETDQTRALSVEGARFVQKPYTQEQLKIALSSFSIIWRIAVVIRMRRGPVLERGKRRKPVRTSTDDHVAKPKSRHLYSYRDILAGLFVAKGSCVCREAGYLS